MKTIAFVTPWYGKDIPGGAEMELRGLAEHLQAAGMGVEVLTTCVRDFSSDWSVDFHPAGGCEVNGVPVRRFRVRPRNTAAFDRINAKLMAYVLPSHSEEQIFVDEMINSPDLCGYIHDHYEDYALFVFIPYMFGTTLHGVEACYDKAVLIPCLHDEAYIYMKAMKERFCRLRGMIFHSKPERELARRVYDLSRVREALLGEGVHTSREGRAKDFRDKYHIDFPYILYAGRKDQGKNVDTLLSHFCRYKKRNPNSLKLILIGGGSLRSTAAHKDDILDLGFVPTQDKYDAYAGAVCLCQPSQNESFSLVVMESWLCGRPVLVNADCAVTKSFAEEAGGGLFFANYSEFEESLRYLTSHEEICQKMGAHGRRYVQKHFAWDHLIQNYISYFKSLVEN
jgi:glycosyltransferase involved in cell wall biosynthesis